LLPITMKAALLHGHGDLDQLEYRTDVPVPHPAAGEVLLKVGAAGLNNTDINLRAGWYSKNFDDTDGTGATTGAGRAEDAGWTGLALRFPRIQGVDACGRIVAVGAGVESARVGERVLVDPVIQPPTGGTLRDARYFGSDSDGAFAEYAVVPATNAHAISSGLTDVELASFPCAYTAAENMLTRAGVHAGDIVLVTGASGGVGSAAIQLARRRGATVIAVAGAAKAAGIVALGAARVVDRGANLVAELGEESVTAVIDVVGGTQFPMLLAVLARGGRYAVAGAIGGAKVELDLRTLYLKDLHLIGCTIPGRDVFDNLVGYIERGEIRPLVSATYPLAAIAAAEADFSAKNHLGKIVLIP
jgi:NADPH:quinone reductase-like Zn-dependent oxidoreductase